MQITVGSHVVIWIHDDTRKYIAEVEQQDPLILKIKDEGPFSCLHQGQFGFFRELSDRFQNPRDKNNLLQEAIDQGHPFISALTSLGIQDGNFYEIHPVKT